MPAAHPLASQEKVAFDSIADADFIGLTDGSALQVHLADRARARQADPLSRAAEELRCDLPRDRERRGIGIVSRHAAERAMQTMDVRLVELSDAWSHRRLKLCARSFDALPKYTREFVAFLSGETAPR